MPLVKDHVCSECTKPRKPQPGQPDVTNAKPCKMVVIDGAVMGPVVFFPKYSLFIYQLISDFYSIVLLKTAPMTYAMLEVVHFVNNMNKSMVQGIIFDLWQFYNINYIIDAVL
jgi:hypothetical protein